MGGNLRLLLSKKLKPFTNLLMDINGYNKKLSPANKLAFTREQVNHNVPNWLHRWLKFQRQ